MKILSWNVNGLRAATRKGFASWIADCGAGFVGVQEARARAEQLDPTVREPEGWHMHLVAGERPGYSGVASYSRRPIDERETSIGAEEFDREGRVELLRIGALRLANVYFPNGNGKNRDNSRVPYKLSFYQRLSEVLQPDIDFGRPVIVMGDFNTAHRAIDLARPQQNLKTSGFLPEEREEFDRWLALGWVDTFRHFHPEAEGAYSWWSTRGGARARNVGWRIDYVLASPAAMPFVTDAFILPDVVGSDHCPVGIEVDDAIFEGT